MDGGVLGAGELLLDIGLDPARAQLRQWGALVFGEDEVGDLGPGDELGVLDRDRLEREQRGEPGDGGHRGKQEHEARGDEAALPDLTAAQPDDLGEVCRGLVADPRG